MTDECSLCTLHDKREIYKETWEFIIIECASCAVPMAVWKKHTMELTEDEEDAMLKALKKVGNELYRPWKYYIDKKQNSVFDHIHWHARPNKSRWRKFYENTADSDTLTEDA